jgi:hypothetical protein
VLSQAVTRGTAKSQRKKRQTGRGEPWGLTLRRAACSCLFASLVLSRLLRLIPAEHRSNTLLAWFTTAVISVAGVGVVLTIISFVGATVSFVTGNTRAFSSESKGELAGWLVAGLVSIVAIFAFGYGYTHPASTLAQSAGSGGGAPGAIPPPGAPPGAAPWPGPGPPVQSDMRVTLSNGRFMRNSSPIGTAAPGVEISVDYKIDAGEPAGIEQFVLVIESRTGRGELNNLHELRFRRSGTIRASSFTASPSEGPYEARLEIASIPGPMGQRKLVSNTIPLQFTDMPVRDPAAEARALQEQMRGMTPPAAPPSGPGFPARRPAGPRGGRFGPGRR